MKRVRFPTYARQEYVLRELETHDPRLSAQCDRTVTLVDGNIESDTAQAAPAS